MKPSVVAIDGAPIEPTPVQPGEGMEIGGGGRYDLWFQAPDGVAAVEVVGSKAALVISPDGSGQPAGASSRAMFDPATRAQAASASQGPKFDRPSS
jgi:hypothetical protein